MDADRSMNRLESLKAGAVGALTATTFCELERVVNQLLSARIDLINALPLVADPWPIAPAIAALTGFLVAVTYRYAVRNDGDIHLKSGIVMAFGLVRGLAQSETALRLGQFSWLEAIALGESLLLVAVVVALLDWSMAHQWIAALDGASKREGESKRNMTGREEV